MNILERFSVWIGIISRRMSLLVVVGMLVSRW